MYIINDRLFNLESELIALKRNLLNASLSEKEKIENKIMKSEMNPLFRFYYLLKINKGKIEKYKEYIKEHKYAIDIINTYISYIEVVQKYYDSRSRWDTGKRNIALMGTEVENLYKFKDFYLRYDKQNVESLKNNFIKIANEVTKNALENPNSEYNIRLKKEAKRTRYNNNNQYNKNQYNNNAGTKSGIPKDVIKALFSLGLKGGNVNATIVKKAYKEMAIKYHPDRGGSTEKMAEINLAYETASKYFNRNKD